MDISELDEAMGEYFDAGLAPSTSRTYSAGISKYLALCSNLSTPPTPASEQLLCRFVTYLARDNISHSTMKVYLAAVRQHHIRQGHVMPPFNGMPRLSQILRGIRISRAADTTIRTRPQCQPITPEILRRIRQTWENEGLSNDRIMLWAAFLLAFYCFLRSGEICVATGESFDENRDLTPQDIAIDNIINPQVLKVHIKYSKTDPFRVGSDIFIAKTDNDLCPVAAVLAWLVRRGNNPGPLFVFRAGVPLTRASFVQVLKEALVAANIEPEGFTGHSFRIGAATSAADRGMTADHIKQLGRWKSEAYQRYIRPSPQRLAGLASSISAQRGQELHVQATHPE